MAKPSFTDLFNQFAAFVERDSGLMASGLILEEFSSKNPAHRLNIRMGIVESNVLTSAENELLLDLNQRPKTTDWNFSISHSDKIGGYIQSDQIIGMDIERSERVLAKTIQRVSSEEEMKAAPGTDYLWTAKEAVFKALALEVMSQAVVTDWQPCTFVDTYKFRAIAPEGLTLKHNLGYSQRIMDHNWTIFFF
ncbi:MAG: 4'-phosphopantetheinyl transferase superfamily protein [Bdellovibrionota bacterium]